MYDDRKRIIIIRQGGSAGQGVDQAEIEKLVNDMQQAQENAKRSQEEVDRLLKLVQMSQEEQNAKEKQIHDLQTSVPPEGTVLPDIRPVAVCLIRCFVPGP